MYRLWTKTKLERLLDEVMPDAATLEDWEQVMAHDSPMLAIDQGGIGNLARVLYQSYSH